MERGPAGGEVVLLIHGLGLSSYSFRSVIEYLGSKGVCAVAIDLPGSGFSDRTIVVEEDVEIVETGQMPYQELDNPRVSRCLNWAQRRWAGSLIR
ncbi:hypothetical protein SAY86_027709 [Trapa natans]|uniref:AB hydrolase-1 domain-containing protein n=1 Tax=Trapa natans TaxID=22666 RepID=A0AAN7KR96_TRANT|nr:hypothetical protein SAY86_027709 [Trapa natans]